MDFDGLCSKQFWTVNTVVVVNNTGCMKSTLHALNKYYCADFRGEGVMYSSSGEKFKDEFPKINKVI